MIWCKIKKRKKNKKQKSQEKKNKRNNNTGEIVVCTMDPLAVSTYRAFKVCPPPNP